MVAEAPAPPPVDDFLAELRRQDASPHTLAAYRNDLAHFGHWFMSTNGEPLASEAITPSDVREYRAHLLTVQGAKPATINRRLAAIRKYLNWAQAAGLVDHNAAAAVKGVETQALAPRGLDKRELSRLVRQVERGGNRRDVALVELLRQTGLRVGELTALRLGDVTLGERSGSVRVRQGKGGKFRLVPLNADVRRALRAYLDIRPAAADDHLFLSNRGIGITPNRVYDLIREYARLAGLTATPHTLRHTFARAALDAGAALVDVAAILGHRRLDTTAVYTQPTQRDLERAVERLAGG